MSNEPDVQSGSAAGPHNDAEYNAVYAAVTATERGRWFLAEYANRNRSADTDLVLAAIARLEAAINSGTVTAAQAVDVSRNLTSAAAAIAPVRAITSERDEDHAASAEPPLRQPQTDTDYAAEAAAIAASLTAPAAAETEAVKAETTEAEATIADAPADAGGEAVTPYDPAPQPQTLEPQTAAVPAELAVSIPLRQDNAPRWHIDSPDFVFAGGDLGGGDLGGGDLGGGDLGGGDLGDANPVQSEPDSERQESDADLLPALSGTFGETSPRGAAAMLEATMSEASKPETAIAEPVIPPPDMAPSAMTRSDIAPPFADIARPQLRIAAEALSPQQRPPRYGALSVADALSEEEVIALFG